MHRHKIIIQKSSRPNADNLNEELLWFCDSLGLFGSRDKDKSCFRLFVILLRALQKPEGLTSDELADKVGLTRGTVIHHLHTLMASGLVKQNMNKYMLRVSNLSALVDEIEKDMMSAMDELRKSADELDKRLLR